MRPRARQYTPIKHIICFRLAETVWLVMESPAWGAMRWAQGWFSSLENDVPPILTSVVLESSSLPSPGASDLPEHIIICLAH